MFYANRGRPSHKGDATFARHIADCSPATPRKLHEYLPGDSGRMTSKPEVEDEKLGSPGGRLLGHPLLHEDH
jgi:hypothetical protein